MSATLLPLVFCDGVSVGAMTGTGESVQLTFDIMEDVSGGKDPTVAGSVANGATLPGNCLRMDANYYIANPRGAQSSFTVTLTQ